MHRRNNTYLLDVWAGTAAQSACSFRSTSQEMLGDVWVSWLHMYVCRQLCTCACSRELYPKHAPTCDADIQTDRPTWTKFFPLQEKKAEREGGDRCACLSVVRPSVYLLACMPAVFRVRPLSSSERFGLSTLLKTKKRPKAWDQEFGSCPVAFFFSRRRIKKRRTNQW